MRIEITRGVAIAALWTALTIAMNPALSAHEGEAHAESQTIVAATAPAPGDPRAVAERFNAALVSGDAETARTLLLPGVVIYESGGVESSAAEYVAHHLPADIAFMAKLKREHLSQTSGGDGASAWVATRSRLSGSYEGKAVDLDSTETMVMTKTPNGWRIAHIHWSSASRGAENP